MSKTQFHHSHFDLLPLVICSRVFYFEHLTRETYAKHSVGAKAFGPPIVVARTPVTFGYYWFFHLLTNHFHHMVRNTQQIRGLQLF